MLQDSPPQALLHEVGCATVRMDLRFWSRARQPETRAARHQVEVAVRRAPADAAAVTRSDVVVVEGGPALIEVLSPGGTTRR